MTTPRLHLFLGIALIAAAGCAQQPHRAAGTTAQAVPGKASTASAPVHAKASAIPAHLLALARDEGYRPKVVNGKPYFCRTEVPTGSLLSTTYCIDQTQLEIQARHDANNRQRLYEPTQCAQLNSCL